MKKCKHENAVVRYLASREEMLWRPNSNYVKRCYDCGAYLSLGPARMTPECEVELRAQHIATEYSDAIVHAWLMCEISDAERDGWEGGAQVLYTLTAAEEAGYLARCIATHDADGG